MEITIGKPFKSRWFDAEAKILSADVDKNTCKVEITSTSGNFWKEDWILSHTKVGFKRGDYFYI